MKRDDLVAEFERLRRLHDSLRTENEQLLESQRTLEDSRDAYAALYDGAPLALLTIDHLGVIQGANLVASSLLNVTRSRMLLGIRLKRFVVPEDQEQLKDHLKRCRAADSVVVCDLRLGAADQPPLRVQLLSRPSAGRQRWYPSAIIDVTERDRVDDERSRLIDSERAARDAMEAKDQFIAVLSHELRTPLTPVLAVVSALLGRPGLARDVRGACEMIRRNILTEARLVDDLLDVTRIARAKMSVEKRPTDVHHAVGHALETVANDIAEKRLVLVVDLAAEKHCAQGDAVRLRQVFWNLLRNAIKFTPTGGRIEVRSWNNDDRLAVEVSDNGIGFDPAISTRLFQPFEQGTSDARSIGGLGLGLAICRGLMELHGGRVGASSRGAGSGARFVVEIDTVAALPAAAEVEPAPTVVVAHGRRRRILLVEDHPDTAMTLGELLEEAGFEVHTATTAKAALTADLETIDLVVSDIGLPDVNGLELMRALRARKPIAGIALSGYGTEADVRASREAGFAEHVTKPVEFDALLAVIEAVTAGRS